MYSARPVGSWRHVKCTASVNNKDNNNNNNNNNNNTNNHDK